MEVGQEKQTAPSISFPEGAGDYSFQVAGHKHGQGKSKSGVLKHKNGNIIKPLLEGDRRSVLELSFYETVFNSKESDLLLQELKRLLPVYHGTWVAKVAGKDVKYLCLEDVCEAFRNPSILDLKIGRITYDKYATEAKIKIETEKYLCGYVTGIRIVGMKTYNEEKNIHESTDRMFLKQVTVDRFISVLGSYLSSNVHINMWLLCGFIHKLYEIHELFSKQRKYEFISSSILFVYEGTSSSWSTWAQRNNICNFSKLDLETNNICNTCGLCENVCGKILRNCTLFRVVMIDFGHCHPSEEIDTNYIFGLQKLIDYFKLLLQSQKEKISNV